MHHGWHWAALAEGFNIFFTLTALGTLQVTWQQHCFAATANSRASQGIITFMNAIEVET